MPDYEDVYVVGDSGMIQSEVYPKGLPMLASVAMQQGKFLAKLFNRQAQNKSSEPFVYVDKGTMATIGRNKAVAEISKLKLQGVLAWAVWMLVHLMLLVGFRNRVVVLVNWAWNYVNYNNGLRLIVRPYVNHLKRETSAELIE
jgi:NADH dehydrogenase